MDPIELIVGDITKTKVDAIVNAANETLLSGGGVDAAIHAAAGHRLLVECRQFPEVTRGVRCPPGEARLTGGYELPAPHVIHTVGPVWNENSANESRRILRACYRSSLRLAEENHLESIAFPCISTGVFGFPNADAAEVAYSEVKNWMAQHEFPRRVVFCCFSDSDAEHYRRIMKCD